MMGHKARSVSAWYGHWEVNHDGVDPADPKPRIWEVTYRMFERDGSIPVAEVDLGGALEELRSALIDARDFASDDDYLTTFVELFDRAQALADDEDPTPPYHDDLLPQGGYATEARRLLAIGGSPARTFPVRLDPELRMALDRRANQDGVSSAEVVRRALVMYLERER